MRPWFDVYEDQVILGYDKANSLYLYSLTIDLDAFENGSEPEPSTEPSEEPSTEPSSETEPSDEPSEDDEKSGCAGGLGLLPLLGLGVWRRRKMHLRTQIQYDNR